jgi:acetyl-CoA acyltransferase
MFVTTVQQQMFKTTTRGRFQKLLGAQGRGQRRNFAWNTNSNGRNVVVVDGIRLPFAQASTIYKDEMAVDLQRMAIKGLLTKTALNKNDIDYVICGTVIQEVRTSNIAREASLNAGLPNTIGSHTVAQVFIVRLNQF